MDSSLLALPTELRLEIYAYLFAAKNEVHNPWYSLLLANKQLHSEMSDLIRDATLRVRVTPRIFQRALLQNLRLYKLGYTDTELDPHARIENFQTYCMRFHGIVFDITETPGPTDCRLPPSYERKGQQLADALTAQLIAATSDDGKGPKIEIKWGSFSRNVHKGIVTWDCCVLKAFGGLMALPRYNQSGLTEVLDCAIVLEERQRLGLLNNSDLDLGSLVPSSKSAAAARFTERIRLAIQSSA
jgi:hypothetical protein